MHQQQNLRRRIAAGVVALVGLAGTGLAQPPAPPTPPPGQQPTSEVKVDPKTGALIVPLGGVVRFKPTEKGIPIREITNQNEDVLDARVDIALPSQLVLVGRRGGVSRLTLLLGEKNAEVKVNFDVVVQPDYELLKTVIRRAVPTATVDVIPGAGNAIILTGSVTKAEDSDTIQRIASDATGGSVTNVINALQIGGSQHVLIDLCVAQVDRSEIRERGFNWGISGTSAGFYSILGGVATPNGVPGGAINPITPSSANLVLGIVPANFVGALQALRTEQLAKILTEPKLVTQTGRPAFFRAGGQQAILSATSGITGPGAILQPVGTELEVLPIVYGNGKIYLEINPRITSVNNGRGIATSFGFTPGFNEQQTRASVMMESGQTFAIGGLLETQTQATTSKVPLLGDMPYFGTLFSQIRHEERETELLILVTPRLVEPMDCGQVPRRVPGKETRSPDDYEVFLETLIEAPRGQRRVWTKGSGYSAAYKSDPTYGQYPCIGNACNTRGGAGYAPPAGNVAGNVLPGIPTTPLAQTAPPAPAVVLPQALPSVTPVSEFSAPAP